MYTLNLCEVLRVYSVQSSETLSPKLKNEISPHPRPQALDTSNPTSLNSNSEPENPETLHKSLTEPFGMLSGRIMRPTAWLGWSVPASACFA